jgi:hypothetical protein
MTCGICGICLANLLIFLAASLRHLAAACAASTLLSPCFHYAASLRHLRAVSPHTPMRGGAPLKGRARATDDGCSAEVTQRRREWAQSFRALGPTRYLPH